MYTISGVHIIYIAIE